MNPQDPKSHGTTASERYLSNLARKSFLSIWSYPNLYTDEGRRANKGAGKELCDLLVVFDNNVIIFSDKHCEFPSHSDIHVAWKRWYKQAISKSARQISGAESWLRRFPKRVYLDPECNSPIPIPVPSGGGTRFFRIAVTRGSYERCRQTLKTIKNSGSFQIDTSILGDKHLETPFTIGLINPARGYVHVLDELTFDILMHEFDTISDFMSYLSAKEVFFTKTDRHILAAGEEELIGDYLQTFDDNGLHSFRVVDQRVENIYFEAGTWEWLIQTQQYQARRIENARSYAWDRLIERFIAQMEHGSTNEKEQALRAMASESRFRRRLLADKLIKILEMPLLPNRRRVRYVHDAHNPATVYVFLVLSRSSHDADYEDYRLCRKGLLSACCEVAILVSPHSTRIVGIAFDPVDTVPASEDLLVVLSEGNGWSEPQIQSAERTRLEFGLFSKEKIVRTESHDFEYPR